MGVAGSFREGVICVGGIGFLVAEGLKVMGESGVKGKGVISGGCVD